MEQTYTYNLTKYSTIWYPCLPLSNLLLATQIKVFTLVSILLIRLNLFYSRYWKDILEFLRDNHALDTNKRAGIFKFCSIIALYVYNILHIEVLTPCDFSRTLCVHDIVCHDHVWHDLCNLVSNVPQLLLNGITWFCWISAIKTLSVRQRRTFRNIWSHFGALCVTMWYSKRLKYPKYVV